MKFEVGDRVRVVELGPFMDDRIAVGDEGLVTFVDGYGDYPVKVDIAAKGEHDFAPSELEIVRPDERIASAPTEGHAPLVTVYDERTITVVAGDNRLIRLTVAEAAELHDALGRVL